ncbi:MAG TPA: GTPase [Thermoleophilaceae bacterium]|nr:GTPase [Thermoleophilaceae bacterium]
MSGELERRLGALAEAVELADGRLDAERVEAARAVVQRAGQRLGLGLEATVVALLGPTGAGKSSLFNALAGAELVSASRRRPTTSSATAAIWGEAPGALLDWLEVPLRHAVGDGTRDGLVLLDMPDFDSVERRHRVEVDRLVELVDVLVWVVDPQKYADGTLHDGYLRPLAAYDDSMLVALNQADTLSDGAAERLHADIGRLLERDGLNGVPVLAVSALTGEGLPALEGEIDRRVKERGAALARLSADVSSTAAELGADCGAKASSQVERAERQRLVAALAGAAGVPTVVGAVAAAHRRSGALATGWPFIRWVRRARPDPLRRLRLGDDRPAEAPEERTSLPAATPLQRSQADSAIRGLAQSAAGELPAPWPSVVRSAATAREDELADRLDRAVAGTPIRRKQPRWWKLAGLLQMLLAGAVVAGVLWLLGLVALGYLQIEDAVPLPEIEGFPLPTLLLVGGILGGLLLASLTRFVNGAGARRRARAAERKLHDQVEGVAGELVIAPVAAELESYTQLCAQLEVAAGRRARRGALRLRG